MSAMAQRNDDDEWDRVPTALEAAHYDDVLRRSLDDEARRRERESDKAKRIFGECLLKLVNLGLPETKARSMLGKWRGQAKDDALLEKVIGQASAISTPDPVSYVTKALSSVAARAATSQTRSKGQWELLGWEKPRVTAKGVRWRNGERGQVWRDPFGKMKVLPAAEGVVVPTIEEDAGMAVEI